MDTFSYVPPIRQSRVLDSNPANQLSISKILQSRWNKNSTFSNVTNKNVVQRINADGTGMVSTDKNEGLVRGKVKYRSVPPSDMTLHHIIPRNKLAAFWNNVKAQNHLNILTNPIKELTKSAIEKDKAGDTLALQIDGGRISLDDVEEYMAYMHNNALPLPANQALGAETIEKIFQWWPANIHYGPTKRLKPGDRGYNPARDDANDNFEESAQQVVKGEIFNVLKKINTYIDAYNISYKIEILQDISRLIFPLAHVNSPTPYDSQKWVEERVNGGMYWRFRV